MGLHPFPALGDLPSVLSKLLRRVAPRGLVTRKQRTDRLVEMYERIERRHVSPWPVGRRGLLIELPPVERIEKVERAALAKKTYDDFTTTLERSADIQEASVAAFRSVINRRREGRARTIALALQRDPATALAGDACRAILAIYDWQPEFAWELLQRQPLEKILPLAPGEYFRAGFAVAPDEAADTLARLLAGEVACTIPARGWRGIANVAFATGHEDLSSRALDNVATAPDASPALTASCDRLRGWYGRRSSRSELDADRPIAFALLDDRSPQQAVNRKGKPDHRQKRVVLRALARRANTSFDGDVRLVRQVHDLMARADPARAGDPAAAPVWLYPAGRNATAYADVPQGTWLVVIGHLPRELFGMTPGFPFDERYRPVFASLRADTVADLRALTPSALEQLRGCGPVGCADWDTYYLMRAADVPAFLADDAPDIVDTLVTRILAGDDEASVYAAWRSAAGPAVSKAAARDKEFAQPLPLRLDVEAACRSIRSQTVVIERREPGPSGPEINLEFSLDGNLKRQMVVCLDSVVRRASRPIRLFVLCRDHGPRDYERLAELFPTVSFVWLPTDNVEHGELGVGIDHITIATMDRLLLPELLADKDRIIHQDIDTVCLTDIAALDDLDLGGHPIAAATSTRGRYQSGFNETRGTAYRLRLQGRHELADELVARSHLRHKLDFDVFNAGVTVFDLARMRADNFCREFFPYAERYEMNDQAVLNAYTGSDRLVLDSAWNWCPRLEDIDEPKIVHWAGRFKPWNPAWTRAEEIWQAAEADAATRARTPGATAQGT